MSVSSSAVRPTLSSVCRQCRQRYFKSPQSQAANMSWSARRQTPETPDSRPARVIKLENQSGLHDDDAAQSLPRWQRTPQGLKSPFRVRPSNNNDTFVVNEDPQKLDEALRRMLGPGGEMMLSEEAKWLAVTHKSYDHGRRGFSDKLAFLGKRIIELQTSLALIDAPTTAPEGSADVVRSSGRQPFEHPALANIEGIRRERKNEVLQKEKIAQLANRYKLGIVVRWKPKQVKRLKASGIDSVLAHTVYAIVGAIALQRGGDAAVKVAREKILHPLGVL